MVTHILTATQVPFPTQSFVYRQALTEANQKSDSELDGWVNALGHELAAAEDLDPASRSVARPLVADRWAATCFVQRRRQQRFAAGTGPNPQSRWTQDWTDLAARVRKETDIVALFEAFGYPRIQQGKEFAGPCPDCGGADRFRVFPEADSRFDVPRAWCRQCGHWYDAIQVVRRLGANIGFFDAVSALANTLSLPIPESMLARSQQSQPSSSTPLPAPSHEGRPLRPLSRREAGRSCGRCAVGSNGHRTDTIPGVALDLPVYSWGDLLVNEFQAQLDLVEGLIQQVTGNIIAGPPSVGKTWLVLTLARAVASGGDWLGHFPTTQGTVLMVDEESHVPGLQSRARMLEEGNPLGRDLPSTSRSGTAHASTPTQAPRTWTP